MTEIRIPYIGSVLSVNHCYSQGPGGGRYLKGNAFRWREYLSLLSRQHIEDMPDNAILIVRVNGYFRDRRSCPDPDNLSKIILDGVAEGLGRPNDKLLRYEVGEWLTGYSEPELVISVRMGGS